MMVFFILDFIIVCVCVCGGGLYTKHILGVRGQLCGIISFHLYVGFRGWTQVIKVAWETIYPPSHLVNPNMINLNMSWPRTHFLSPKEYIYTTPLDSRYIGERDAKTVRGKT